MFIQQWVPQERDLPVLSPHGLMGERCKHKKSGRATPERENGDVAECGWGTWRAPVMGPGWLRVHPPADKEVSTLRRRQGVQRPWDRKREWGGREVEGDGDRSRRTHHQMPYEV